MLKDMFGLHSNNDETGNSNFLRTEGTIPFLDTTVITLATESINYDLRDSEPDPEPTKSARSKAAKVLSRKSR